MSFGDIMGVDFTPSAAFSFEFYSRNPDGSKGSRIAEIFFMLPPEDYSLQEGYRVTLTKTANGGWIDDFGNDFKSLRLAGSLYSYYSGYPTGYSAKDSSYKKVPEIQKIAVGAAIGAAQSIIGTEAKIPGMGAMTGLEEFFRLRYIISRFRDAWPNGVVNPPAIYTPEKRFFGTEDLISASQNNQALWDHIIAIYHDYDDSNHFEVIFDKFSMSRNKADPFTVEYSIDMTCMRGADAVPYYSPKTATKDDPLKVVNDIRETTAAVLDGVRSIAALPLRVASYFSGVVRSVEGIFSDFTAFADGVKSDWKAFTSRLDYAMKNDLNVIDAIFVLGEGFPVENLNNEEADLSDLNYDLTIQIEDDYRNNSQMGGVPKFYSDRQQAGIFETDNDVLTDEDFDADAAPKAGNVWKAGGATHYTVVQGDTLQTISLRFYGDPDLSGAISRANNLSNRSFEGGAMVGRSIIIPLREARAQPPLADNLVYTEKLGESTPEERTRQILGSDFKFNQERDLVADGTGDLAMVYGRDTIRENVVDRLLFEAGTLGPSHPGWGVELVTGSIAAPIAAEKTISTVERQASVDPRVQSAAVDRVNAEVQGDVVRIPIVVNVYGGEPLTIDAGPFISGIGGS